MESKRFIKISSIITAVMLFLQFGTWIVNDLLWTVLQWSSSFRLPDYLPLQVALISASVLSLITRKKDTLTEKVSASSVMANVFSKMVHIFTIVVTVLWGLGGVVVDIIKVITIVRINHSIENQDATIGELVSAQASLNNFEGVYDFMIAFCLLLLLVIAFINTKDRGYAIKAEFAKIATVAIVMIVSFFNTVIFIANSILARTSGPEVLSKMHTALSGVSLIVTLMATLALAVVALLLGLISKKEKESV